MSKRDKLHLLFLLLAFLWFTIGVARAQVLALPPNPSRDLHTFQRQIIYFNANRALIKIQESNRQIKLPEPLVRAAKDVSTNYSPDPNFKYKFGVQLQKGLIYSEFYVLAPTIINRIDTINNKYSLQVVYSSYKLYYDKFYRTGDYSFGLAKSIQLR